MNKIKIKCPAKINLDLKILNKRDDGFHEIKSTMQSIDLYDYLTISKNDGADGEIKLSGNSNDIPYDEKNLVYKAATAFFNEIEREPAVSICIEKNIPICAGLAGGSTDAAGAIYGLNKMYGDILGNEKINEIASTLGSDLNFCLNGGKMLAAGRGEILTPLEFEEFNLTLVKPNNLSISTPYAYKKFDEKGASDAFKNDLEYAIIDEFDEIKYLHDLGFQMTGSGSAFFKIGKCENLPIGDYFIREKLNATPRGVAEVFL